MVFLEGCTGDGVNIINVLIGSGTHGLPGGTHDLGD
jgi:hypothetical protein